MTALQAPALVPVWVLGYRHSGAGDGLYVAGYTQSLFRGNCRLTPALEQPAALAPLQPGPLGSRRRLVRDAAAANEHGCMRDAERAEVDRSDNWNAYPHQATLRDPFSTLVAP